MRLPGHPRNQSNQIRFQASGAKYGRPFPPRGFGPDANEKAPDRRWGDPGKLSKRWDYQDRKVLLGTWQGRLIGDPDAEGFIEGSGDDRHFVTIAGSRAGKSRSVLIPNLLRYRGSVLVIDPKGELVRDTAKKRQTFGDVFVLDPFNIVPAAFDELKAEFNPLQELDDSTPETLAADAALIADALIESRSGQDAHWTDSAKNLIRGLSPYLHSRHFGRASLGGLRDCLTAPPQELHRMLTKMASDKESSQVVANTGKGFLAKFDAAGEPTTELRSILSTANEQTWPLDDVIRVSQESHFGLACLTQRVTTIYLVIPGTRLATHAKWLRVIVNLVMAAIERHPVKDLRKGALPVWVVLEEFAALGRLRSIEAAAGFMAGMGCKLWVVLQDLTQLKTHYPQSWETFLGNAGIIQAWSNIDATTTEYLSKLIGQTTILETRYENASSQAHTVGDIGERTQFRSVPLLDPAEIAFHFARETKRQLILSPGRPPLAIERLNVGDEEESRAQSIHM